MKSFIGIPVFIASRWEEHTQTERRVWMFTQYKTARRVMEIRLVICSCGALVQVAVVITSAN